MDNTKPLPNRRAFVKKALLGLAALGTTTQAQAFSLTNPGRDAKDPRHIGQKGKRFGMVIDLRKCVGCQACTSACKNENKVPKEKFRTYVPEYELGAFPTVRKTFLPQLCNHCAEPSCVSVCPTGATFAREDGIVVVDSEICWGCGYCINACPYDKRFFNPITYVADKCTLCAHRLDAGLLPACVESCVGGARISGDFNDPHSEVSKLLAQFPANVLKPSSGNQPRVFYIGLSGEIQGLPFSLGSLDDHVKKINGDTRKEWTSKGV
ncbi:MAG: 4Fe-4S dicluster domain-containing protein [Bacteroidia bacterium]|nr:4Fe-4S dicluster domain-containing protein [Bacteroidia bacterium]NCD12190.1 4Fe-4S dicluster domain-containing protein [Campylobacterota bacterium]